MAVRRQEDVYREFLCLYETYPCLWKVESSDYKDFSKKREAYEALAEVLKQVNPDADVDTVKRKINSMRSCFRKEYKRVMDSITSSVDSGKVHQPTLWYYNLLLFLKDQKSANCSIKTDVTDIRDYLEKTDEESEDESEAESHRSSNGRSPIPEMPLLPLYSDSEISKPSHRHKQQKRRLVKLENDLDVLGKRARNSETEDEFDIVGKNVAKKLRNLDPVMRIFAEKLINDSIFEAQLGTLNRYAHIIIPKP